MKLLILEQIKSLEEFLAVHRNFKLLITDRFHGSITSFVMGDCPVIGIEEEIRYPQKNSKVRDLYQRLGIEPMIHYHHRGDTLDKYWLEDYCSRWKLNKGEMMNKIMKLRADAVTKFNMLSK